MSSIHDGFAHAFDILADPEIGPTSLYEIWWSGPRSSQFIGPIETTFHPEQPSRFRFRSGNAEFHTVGHTVVMLQAGDFYNSGDGTSVIKRRRTWASDHFNWRQGLQPNVFPFQSKTIRAYIPSHTEETSRLAMSIGDHLDEARIPFQLKFRREIAVYRDSIVVWVDEAFLAKLQITVDLLISTSQAIATPPPLTLHSRSVGYSEQAVDGSSPGWTFSSTLWTISRLPSEHDPESSIRARGLDPHHPWRLSERHGSDWELTLR